MDCLLSDRGAEDMTLALIRRDFALLCRKTTADCLRNDCIVVRKLTALCQQIVSTFFPTALHFLERRIGSAAENIRDFGRCLPAQLPDRGRLGTRVLCDL